jgi:hypothetical protein
MAKEFPPPTKPNPTAVKAAPTGVAGAFGDFIGGTIARGREGLQEMGSAVHNNPLAALNPSSSARLLMAALKTAGAPLYAVGQTAGAAAEPSYGKPGNTQTRAQALDKWGTLAEAALPMPGGAAGNVGATAAEVAERTAAPIVREGARIASDAAAPVTTRIADALSLGRQSKAAVADLRSVALAHALEQSRAHADAAAAAAAEAKAAAEAAQTATTKANSVAPIGVGQVSHLTDLGAPARTAVTAQSAKAQAELKDTYETLSAAANDISKENEAKGVFISDLPAAKSLLKEAENVRTANVAAPDLASAGKAPPVPTTGQARAYGMIETALKDRVIKLPDGTTQTFKTPLEAVTNLRRWFGDAASFGKPVEGFEGVNSSTFKDMYKRLGDLENQFTNGASKVAKDAYAQGLAKVEPYRVGLGGKMATTQGATEIPATAASKVPAAVAGSGREGFDQFLNLVGDDKSAAQKFANDLIETKFYDSVGKKPLDYDTAAALVKPGTPLGDMLEHPALKGLKTKVDQHLAQLRDAKMAGVDAVEFGKRAEAATKAAESLKAPMDYYKTKFTNLSNLPDKKVVSEAKKIFDEMATDGIITQGQYADYLEQINSANALADRLKSRNKIMGYVAKAIGFGGAAAVGVPLVHSVGG